MPAQDIKAPQPSLSDAINMLMANPQIISTVASALGNVSPKNGEKTDAERSGNEHSKEDSAEPPKTADAPAPDLSALDCVTASFSHLPDRDPGEHWYDDIKLPQSISKKGKKAHTAELDAMTAAHFDAYLNAPSANVTDIEKKRELSARYVNGLLERGGPSTDVFKKTLGMEATEKLFRNVLFGTN